MNFKGITDRVWRFEAEAHEILGSVEGAAQSRLVKLRQSYSQIETLSVEQDDLLRQALRCVEGELYRAAHVMSWAALADYLEKFAAEDNFTAINGARPKWNVSSLEDLRDRFTEYAIIEAMKVGKLIRKNQMKSFHGLLNKRNECAHPSDFYPDLNMTLGFISEILNRIRTLENKRSPNP